MDFLGFEGRQEVAFKQLATLQREAFDLEVVRVLNGAQPTDALVPQQEHDGVVLTYAMKAYLYECAEQRVLATWPDLFGLSESASRESPSDQEG